MIIQMSSLDKEAETKYCESNNRKRELAENSYLGSDSIAI